MNTKGSSFSLLESTLQMYGAEKYIQTFKKHGIDSKTLPLLNEDDLKAIGIDDEKLQEKLVRQCRNLPKRNDGLWEAQVNDKFVLTVIQDIEMHMKLLHACLSVCVVRKDVQISDIKLRNGIETLLNCTILFTKELQTFKHEVFPGFKTTTRSKKWKYLIPLIITSTASFYTFKKYFYS